MKRIAIAALAFALMMGVHASSSPASGVATQQWVARYNGPGNGWDHAAALAVDGSGNVYVTGNAYSASTNNDYTTVKYNSAGQQQWVKTYNGTGNGSDEATALALDGSGNVYVTGASYQGASTGIDYTMVRYGSDGTEWWVHAMDCSAHGQDEALAVAVDGSDNSYFTGYCDNGGTNYDDYATVKLDALGVSGWTRNYNSGAGNFDWGQDVAVDGSGNVYVTGLSNGDYTTLKYNSGGTQQWVKTYNGTGNGGDSAKALALDASGNVYVSGTSYGGGAVDDDYATVKYDSAGTEQWAIRYNNGSANGADTAVALAVDGSGNVYVTGTSYGGASTNYDYATVKYSQAGAAGVGGIAELPDLAPGAAQPSDAPPEGSGWSGGTYAALAAGDAAAAHALAGAGWYARRRWLKA